MATGCTKGESKLEGKPDTFKVTSVEGGFKIEGRLFAKKGVFKGITVDLTGPGAVVLRPDNSTLRLATSPTPSETNVPAPAFKRLEMNTLECAVPDFELPAGTEDLFVSINVQNEGGAAGSYALDVKVVPANDNSQAFINKLSITSTGKTVPTAPGANVSPVTAPTGASSTAPAGVPQMPAGK
jgi:hypothetical protein